jgi:hypothetical protein
MPITRLQWILGLIIILALCVSCAPQAAMDSTAVMPTISPKTMTLVPDFTATIVQPTPTAPATRRAPRATAALPKDRRSDASQNLPLDVPAHPVDVILGRPTQGSITVSVLAYQDLEGFIEYGAFPEDYSSQTQLLTFSPDQPREVLIDGLQANTQYAYRLRYRAGNTGEYAATEAGSFQTQRASGSPFIFTIQSDSHLDSKSNPQVYLQTLANERADQPDFTIDLGDTFMTDKYQPYREAQAQYLAQRYYLSLIGQSSPLFLALGNHDGEGAPRGGTATDMSAWSTTMRMMYFPNPVPDDFYTGNSTPEESVGVVQDYYAWEWGEALFIVLDPYRFTPPGGGATDIWNKTLGDEQYQWLKKTLESGQARWKFVFIHQLVGGLDKNGRGGIEVANYYEWGGENADGSWGFDQQRPGWAMPIHQLLVANGVTAVFHGHDHLFVKQELDGIIYQAVPQPSAARSYSTNSAAEYGYVNGDILGSSGHLRVTVTPDQVTVEYVRAYLPQDEKPGQQNGQVDFTYTILPR